MLLRPPVHCFEEKLLVEEGVDAGPGRQRGNIITDFLNRILLLLLHYSTIGREEGEETEALPRNYNSWLEISHG